MPSTAHAKEALQMALVVTLLLGFFALRMLSKYVLQAVKRMVLLLYLIGTV